MLADRMKDCEHDDAPQEGRLTKFWSCALVIIPLMMRRMLILMVVLFWAYSLSPYKP